MGNLEEEVQLDLRDGTLLATGVKGPHKAQVEGTFSLSVSRSYVTRRLDLSSTARAVACIGIPPVILRNAKD